MNSWRIKGRHRGFIDIETIVSISLLVLLTGVVTDALFEYYRTHDHYVWRQAAAWAAEAQLQRYRAGAPVNSPPPDSTIADGIELATNIQPGGGQWAGFNRVSVTAQVTLPTGQRVHEEISGYVRAEAKP